MNRTEGRHLRGRGLEWTAEEIETLRKMYFAGNSDSEIGIALARHPTSIMHKRYALRFFGRSKKPPPSCADCSKPISEGATRCSRCHGLFTRRQQGAKPYSGQTFSMVSPEEILEGGVRRRLYGDLRGI